jgi:hypothetical protein
VFEPESEPLESDSEPALLSEAINRHMAFGRDVPQTRVTEGMLTFACLRCDRTLSAAQTVVTRNPGEVVYTCPHDDATLVTIQTSGTPRGVWDYSFSEGELTIRVGDEQVAWWEFVGGDDDS